MLSNNHPRVEEPAQMLSPDLPPSSLLITGVFFAGAGFELGVCGRHDELLLLAGDRRRTV